MWPKFGLTTLLAYNFMSTRLQLDVGTSVQADHAFSVFRSLTSLPRLLLNQIYLDSENGIVQLNLQICIVFFA